MFERFVEEAVRSILAARDEARRLGHPAVGTEHLLVGLHQNEHKIARLLGTKGKTLVDLKAAVAKLPGGASLPAGGDLPFSSDAQKAISMSWAIAEEFHHNTIVPLHMLMAILRVDSENAHQVLVTLGIQPEELSAATREVLAPTKPAQAQGGRTGYQEEDLEIATPYGPVTLALVRLPNRAREDARIISISSEGFNGPAEVTSFLSEFDRLLDSSSSGVTVTFFRDLFLGLGNKLESYLQPEGN